MSLSAERDSKPVGVRRLGDAVWAWTSHLGAAGRVAWGSLRTVSGVPGGLVLSLIADLAIVASLALLPFLVFWRLLTSVPEDAATFPLGDITELWYPYRRYIATELARGELPFWNPYVSAGHPVLGDIQHAVFYPIGLAIAEWAGPSFPMQALALQVIVHFSIAGVFTYLLGRRLFATRAAAAFGAVVFAFGGYLTSFPVQQIGILQTIVWLPLILFFLELAIAVPSVALALPAALGIAAAALAGHPQTLLYVLAAAAGYVIVRAWSVRGDRPVAVWRVPIALVAFVVAVGVGLGLAAGQLLPALEHLELTDRTTASYEFTTTGFALHEIVGLVFPERFGGLPLYHGLLSIVLVTVAIAAGLRRTLVGFWLVLGVAALLIAFGANTFLQQPLYLLLGSFKLRDHQRIACLVALAIAMIAARGLDVVIGNGLDVAPTLHRIARWLRWGLIAAAGLLVLFLYGSTTAPSDDRAVLVGLSDRAAFGLVVVALSAGWFELARRRALPPWLVGALAVLLVAFDLLSTGAGRNQVAGLPAQHFPETPIVQALQDRASESTRIASEGLLPADGNAGMLYRIPDIVGNSPLELESYHRFDREVDEWQRWRLLNVQFLVTRRDLDGDGRFDPIARHDDLRLYELKAEHRLPRAWLVYRTLPAETFDDALELTNRIDPRTEAVVTLQPPSLPEPPGVLVRLGLVAERQSADSTAELAAAIEQLERIAPPTSATAPGTDPGTARLLTLNSNDVAYEVDAPRSALLVVGEVWHPSWRVTVDGSPAPLLQVNAVLRGVIVPAGAHRVEMRFVSESYQDGVAIARQAAQLGGPIILAELLARGLLALVSLRSSIFGRRKAKVESESPEPPVSALPHSGSQG